MKVFKVKCYYSGYMEYEVEAEDESDASDIAIDLCYKDYPDISGVDNYEVEKIGEEEDGD